MLPLYIQQLKADGCIPNRSKQGHNRKEFDVSVGQCWCWRVQGLSCYPNASPCGLMLLLTKRMAGINQYLIQFANEHLNFRWPVSHLSPAQFIITLLEPGNQFDHRGREIGPNQIDLRTKRRTIHHHRMPIERPNDQTVLQISPDQGLLPTLGSWLIQIRFWPFTQAICPDSNGSKTQDRIIPNRRRLIQP